jgi:predicted 2-oxoglutarate/Fe(II)-dependent dioxygenase YbiX
MKNISRKYRYDAEFFSRTLAPELVLLPSADHDLPIFVAKQLLSADECDRLVTTLREREPNEKSEVEILQAHHDVRQLDERVADIVAKGSRNSLNYQLPVDVETAYRDSFNKVKRQIEDYFGVTLGQSSGSHALGYGPGGLYGLHADNCDPVFDSQGGIRSFAYKRSERQISTLLYLTDSVDEINARNQCIGGNLSFPFLRDENDEPLLVEPERGLFLAFPSHPVFAHEVHEVYEGFRMTIVDWYSAEVDTRPRDRSGEYP